MSKRVILVTGTPCVGKTTVANYLATELGALNINLTYLANKYNLSIGEDKERKTTIIDEEKMRNKIGEIICSSKESTIVVDGHYAAAVVPKRSVTFVFVLRRNPIELRKFMEKCGFHGPKLWENLASEILDVCLVEALQEYQREKVCELDVTGLRVENVSSKIVSILNRHRSCSCGCVDWLGMLEKKGLISAYLKI